MSVTHLTLAMTAFQLAVFTLLALSNSALAATVISPVKIQEMFQSEGLPFVILRRFDSTQKVRLQYVEPNSNPLNSVSKPDGN